MRVRKRQAEEGPPDDVESAVRAAAASIAKRFENTFPEPNALAADAEFLAASEMLAQSGEPFELIGKLTHDSIDRKSVV